MLFFIDDAFFSIQTPTISQYAQYLGRFALWFIFINLLKCRSDERPVWWPFFSNFCVDWDVHMIHLASCSFISINLSCSSCLFSTMSNTDFEGDSIYHHDAPLIIDKWEHNHMKSANQKEKNTKIFLKYTRSFWYSVLLNW